MLAQVVLELEIGQRLGRMPFSFYVSRQGGQQACTAIQGVDAQAQYGRSTVSFNSSCDSSASGVRSLG